MPKGIYFINATHIGQPWNKGKDYIFTSDFVKKFKFISDAGFEPLKTQLILAAEESGIPNSPGYRMFTYQAQMCIKEILGIEPDLAVLEKYVIKAFS